MAKRPAKTAPNKIVRQLTPEAEIVKLLKRCKSAKEQTGEINGSVSQKIAEAVDKKHLHKKAFSHIRSMFGKDPELIAAWWDHLNHYYDASGMRERAESAPGLPMDDDEKTGEGEAEAARAGNVVRPGRFSDNKDQAQAGGTPG